MEYEATVVLEKDYLKKARNSTKSGDDAILRPPAERGSTLQAECDDADRGRNPSSDSSTRLDAARPRQDPLAKPGWFDRG